MATLTDRKSRRAALTRLETSTRISRVEGVRDDLDRGILTTVIDPALAKAITIGFMAAIVALPLVQAAIELIGRGEIQALKVLMRVPTRANLDQFEKELGRQSFAERIVQPRLQLSLCRDLGFGTTNVILGRDGWLFYRPGIDWLTGPGILDPSRIALRKGDLIEAGEANPSPDPRPAILAFRDDCREAGVELVLVPVPDKAMVESAKLTSRFNRYERSQLPANIDYQRFLDELRSAGVDVFDPSPMQVSPNDPPRFLRQDTHWTPSWMETVAHNLADHLKTRVVSLRNTTRSWSVRDTQVSHVGDIADMLKLPAGNRLYPPETVTIHRVLEPRDGRKWQPSPQADVLVLGDSFSNIYCTADLGWGEAAGFPAQLARFLGRDVDVIARNGSGAVATRRELARQPDQLIGRKVVVWEFAARELMLANWEVVRFSAARALTTAREPIQTPAETALPLVLEGTIVATSRVPQPFAVPYKDCLTYVKLRVDHVVEGTLHDSQAIAVLWGMRDNVRLPAADYPSGKRLRLKLVPLRKAPVNLRTVRSADDLDDYEHQPYYVLEEQK